MPGTEISKADSTPHGARRSAERASAIPLQDAPDREGGRSAGLFGPMPYERWEWVVMRTLFLIVAVLPAAGYHIGVAGQPAPIGIAQFADLTFLLEPGWRAFARGAVWLAAAAYALGVLPFSATLVLFLVHVGYGTLANSQGAIHHTSQIVGLVLFGQLLAHGGRALRHWTGRERFPDSRARIHRDLIHASQQMVVAAYVTTGISKLVGSEGRWLHDLPNIALQFEKNYGMRLHDTLQEPALEANRWMIAFIAEHPHLARLFFGAGLCLELFAFLALWNRRSLALFGIGLWFLHSAVSEIMLLGFAYNKWLLLIFFVNAPWWIARFGRRMFPGLPRLGSRAA